MIKWETICKCGNQDKNIEDIDIITNFSRINASSAKCVLCGEIVDIRMKTMCEINSNKECNGCLECLNQNFN